MAKQITIYYNMEDCAAFLRFFDEAGAILVSSDGKPVFSPDSDKNVYIVSKDHFRGEKIDSVKTAEAIEFLPCRSQAKMLPDLSRIFAKLESEFPGCIYQKCIINNSTDLDRRFHELLKETDMIPNPDYFNGTEAGRLFFEPYIQSDDGKKQKSAEICGIFSKTQRFIKERCYISEDKLVYIAPNAYNEYKSGSFIPCFGKSKVYFT